MSRTISIAASSLRSGPASRGSIPSSNGAASPWRSTTRRSPTGCWSACELIFRAPERRSSQRVGGLLSGLPASPARNLDREVAFGRNPDEQRRGHERRRESDDPKYYEHDPAGSLACPRALSSLHTGDLGSAQACAGDERGHCAASARSARGGDLLSCAARGAFGR